MAIALATAIFGSAASAQTYSNSTPITINDNAPASPYPSSITVSGAFSSSIGYFAVTLKGFSHTYVGDVVVLLVSPAGQKILLMNGAIGSGSAENVTLGFVASGQPPLPADAASVASGFYTCSVYNTPVSLTPPAPAGPYGTSLAPLVGTNPNGTWSLYVLDKAPRDSGVIAKGWSISFGRTPSLPISTAFTYQGKLSVGNVPVSGDVNVRYTLCNNATEAISLCGAAPAITRNLTGITDGLVTTTLDFGSVMDTSQALWLNVEVESPPGSGFVALTPRQPISATPQARVAENANAAATVPFSGITGVPANVSNAFSPWSASGSNITFIGGSVGIGTTAPASALHVAQSANIVGTIESSNTIGTWFNLLNSSPGGRYWRLISTGVGNGEGAGNLLFGSGTISGSNTNVMLLQSATGNVGIGTITPSQRLTVNGNVLANNVGVPSSGRFKHNVVPMADALEKVLKLEGVTFDWNPDFAKERPGREHDIGFVAEDVAKVFPEVVFYDPDGKVTGMDYSRLTAVAVQAIKQQQAKFEAELAKRDAEALARQQELDDLKSRLARLEQLIGQRR